MKLVLPLFDDLSGLLEIAYLITFTIGYATRERVNGRGCLFDAASQVSQAVVYRSFSSGVFICNSPGALSMRDHTLVSLHGLAFTLRGSLARFFHASDFYQVQDHGRLAAEHISKNSLFRLKITVGCPP